MSEHCKGIKKNGEPCRVTANLLGGYCRLHRKQAAGGHADADERLVLERSPQTGIPHYVSCVEDPKKRWVALTAVTIVAALIAALSFIFCNHGRKRAK